jgi:hypothetical protein
LELGNSQFQGSQHNISQASPRGHGSKAGSLSEKEEVIKASSEFDLQHHLMYALAAERMPETDNEIADS